ENLVGVVNMPSERRDVAVLMLTPGMLHHTGPYRLHVIMARELAKQGIASLRYDLSGIGESLGVGESGSSLERASREAQYAMDRMQADYGIKKFILFGLCSGADDGLYAALKDDRIVGLALLDGCGYRTLRYHVHRCVSHYLPRMFRMDKWKRLLKRGKDDQTAQSLQMGVDIREYPDQEVAEHQISELADRGVAMRFVYTGGVADYFNYSQQFFDMFPSLRGRKEVSTQFFPDMDHLAMLREDRVKLLNDLTGWLSTCA
ncbi:MAG: alpha/beta hydrolase, partial [Planctomycetota bacterium]